MTAKQYLFGVRRLRENIKKCEEGIESLRHSMTGVSAMRYDKVMVQTSPDSHIEEQIDKLMSLESKLRDLKYSYWTEVIFIQTEIYSMPKELHRKILSEYFLSNKTISRIAYETNYDRQYIYNQYSIAIKEFDAIYRNHVKKCETENDITVQ